MTNGMFLYSMNVFLVGLNVGHCVSQALRDGRVEVMSLSAFMVTTLAAILTYPRARREMHI